MKQSTDGFGMPQIRGELVTFYSGDNTRLDGILYAPASPRAIVLHVHGSLGNFYHNHFLRWMAAAYFDVDVAMLSFNLQAHDGIAEGYDRAGDFRYIGGSLVSFDSCIQDIQGAIQFGLTLAPEVVLQGHSLGCDRVTWYAAKSGFKGKLILLSPCDSLELQQRWLLPKGENVRQQIDRLNRQNNSSPAIEQLVTSEYGVHQKGEDYINPVSVPTLLSIMKGPAFSLFCKGVGIQVQLPNRAIAVIGGADPLQTWDYVAMAPLVQRILPAIQMMFYESCDHEFSGVERDIAQKLASWIVDNLTTK